MNGNNNLMETELRGYVSGLLKDLQETREHSFHEDVYLDKIEDRDESKWELITGSSSRRIIDEPTLSDVRGLCRALSKSNPHAHTILKNYEKYIIGKGMKFTPVDMEDKSRLACEKYWREWSYENAWPLKEGEIVYRAAMDGEVFLRFWGGKMRFMQPERVKDPDGKVTFGIQTKRGDVETPRKYYYADTNGTRAEKIDAKDVEHIKLNSFSDVKRGIPLLHCVLTRIRRYDRWLEDRIKLNKLRTAVALLRRHKGGSPSDIAAFADAKKTDTKYDARTGKNYRRQIFRGGSVIDIGPGLEYEFLSPKLDARDVAEDGRHILLSIAVGVGQAEYQVSGDNQKVNYSSTRVTEDHAGKGFDCLGRIFIYYFRRVWFRVMRQGVRDGVVPKKALKGDVVIDSPRVLLRNVLDEAKADEVYLNNGAMSRRTMTKRAGLDPEKEALQIEEEAGQGQYSSGLPAEKEPPRPRTEEEAEALNALS